MIKNHIDALSYFNLTPTTPLTNFSTFDPQLNALLSPSIAYIQITYSVSLDKDTKTILYFTIFSILQHLWFVKAVRYCPWVPGGSNSSGLNFSIALPLSVLSLFVISILWIRRKRP